MSYKDKNKQREYNRIWIANRRKEFFQDKDCSICHSKQNLELDHINPETKVSHSIWSWSEKRRLLELEKCQVLCYFCHLEKTKKQLQKPITHGNSGYGRGCRCKVCFSSHSERMKTRNRKRL